MVVEPHTARTHALASLAVVRLPWPVVVALRGGEAGLDGAYAVRAGVGGIGQTPGVGHVGEGSQALIPQTKGRSQSAPGPRGGSEARDLAWRASGEACEAGFSHRGQLDLQWWTTGKVCSWV